MNSVSVLDHVSVSDVKASEGRVLVDKIEELVLELAAIYVVVLQTKGHDSFILLQAFNE